MSFLGRLDPDESLGEILAGLIMVLTFTLAAGVMSRGGQGGVRTLLNLPGGDLPVLRRCWSERAGRFNINRADVGNRPGRERRAGRDQNRLSYVYSCPRREGPRRMRYGASCVQTTSSCQAIESTIGPTNRPIMPCTSVPPRTPMRMIGIGVVRPFATSGRMTLSIKFTGTM